MIPLHIRFRSFYFLSRTVLDFDAQLITYFPSIPFNLKCKEQLEWPAFRGGNRVAGRHLMSIVSLPASEFPYAMRGCAQIFFYRKHTSLDEPIGSTGIDIISVIPHYFMNMKT